MKITRINDKHIIDEIMYLRENNTSNLLSTGFKTLDEYYQIRPSNTTIIYGYPASGKSEFALQLLVGLSTSKYKRSSIYTPETGGAAEIFSEIAHSLTGKTFDKIQLSDEQNTYLFQKELILTKGSYLHFKDLGFERQLFF